MTKKDKTDIKKINIHKGHRERLRKEMLACNFNPTSEHKLLEFLLTYCYKQKDVNPIAHNLINTFGNFSNVLEARYNDLLKVDGIGENTATFLYSLRHINQFYLQQKSLTKIKLQTSKDFYEYFGKHIAYEDKEKILLITLNSNFQTKKCVFLSSGSENEVAFDPLEIYNIAHNDDCANIILMHNHPSGNPRPSPNDDFNTKTLVDSLKNFRLNLIDHLIVAKDSFYSYSDEGKLYEYSSTKPKI